MAVDETGTNYLGHLLVDGPDEANELVINEDVAPVPLGTWWTGYRAAFNKAEDIWLNNQWSHAMRHLMNFKVRRHISVPLLSLSTCISLCVPTVLYLATL